MSLGPSSFAIATLAFVVSSLVGCGGDDDGTIDPDAGAIDARQDASDDSGPGDDSGPTDGAMDTGTEDAGPSDAGADAAPVVTVFDLASDWSDATNPFGAWELRAGSVPMSTLQADWADLTGQSAWANAQAGAGHIPGFFRVAVVDAALEDLEIGDIGVHSRDDTNGAGLGEARIVWTSPASGTVSVAGGIWMSREIGRANDWTLSIAGSPLAMGSVSDGDAFDRDTPFAFADGGEADALNDVAIVEGDEVVLEIVQASGSPFGDTVGVELMVTLSASP